MADFDPRLACTVWFKTAEGIGRQQARVLLEACGDFEKLFWTGPELHPTATPDQRLALKKSHHPENILSQLNQLQRNGIHMILPGSPFFPKRLQEIEDPPLLLYGRGEISLMDHERPLAIVGTRHPTQYGRKVTEMLAQAAAEQGAMVVSGLAVGIDAIAHQTALDCNAPTLAVLGCGIDINYPSANASLRKRILSDGLILTEQPPGMPALPAFFPDRNRLISGLSTGIVVVEAVIKSGTMSTALHGIQQGKEVFAVPGNIDAPQSAGTNFLIQNMAQILTTPEDLFCRLDWRASKRYTPKLSDSASTLLKLVRRYGDMTIDDLIEATGWPAEQLYEFLSELEIKRLIRCWFGRYNLK
jgi:DNA processing protein